MLFNFHSVYFYAKQPIVIQENALNILQRAIPQLLAKMWHHPLASQDLMLGAQNMIYLIIDGILVSQNLVQTPATSEKGPSNLQVSQFYHELYLEALRAQRSPLLEKENADISHQLVELLEGHFGLCRDMLELYPTFAPYEFFVSHADKFYPDIAKCYKLAHTVDILSGAVSIKSSLLSEKLHWTSDDETLNVDHYWKIRFMELIFAPEFENMDRECEVFSKYLLLFDQWIPLLRTSQHFLYTITNITGRNIMLDAIESRMMLKSRSHYCSDGECLIILNFMNEIFDNDSYFFITNLFYTTQPRQYDKTQLLIDRFESGVCRVMGTSKWFLESSILLSGPLNALNKEEIDRNIEFSCQKPFANFLCNKLQTYFSNTLLVNKQILYYIQLLGKFDLSYSDCYPIDILLRATRLLESINLPVYKVLASPKFQSIEFILDDSVVCEFKKEGVIRNVRLFENLMGTLYAIVRLKKARGVHKKT